MSRQVVVVEPGRGDRVGNVELLARTVDTPFFNLSVVTLRPGEGVESHRHAAEDDSWLVLDGTLTVRLADDGRTVEAGAGTFVLVPVGTAHELLNAGATDVRFLNIHSPGGFDRRIGWRPRRTGVLATTLVALAALLLTAGGPASAAGLTKAKVQQIATSVSTKVVEQQAPRLSVSHARSADSAMRATAADAASTATTAGQARNADRLGGAGPAAYLERGGFSEDVLTATVGKYPTALVSPVSVTVPAGVGFVHVTGVSGFVASAEGWAVLSLATGTSCAGVADGPRSYGSTGEMVGHVTIDRLVAVAAGTHSFTLCGATTVPSSVMTPTLTVETVATGPTG